MLKPLALTIAVVVVASAQPARPQPESSTADFPPQDSSLAFTVSRGDAKARAARLLAAAPGEVETIRAHVGARDASGALRTLRIIVDSHPERIPDAVHALGDLIYELRGDNEATRRNQDTLLTIVAAARAKLPALPREAAALAERGFIAIDGELARDFNGWPARLARFVEQYDGTETALLAQVDAIAARQTPQDMLAPLDAFIAANPRTNAAAKALYQKGFQWSTGNLLGTVEPRDADPTSRFLRVLDIVNELQGGSYPASEWTAKAPALITSFFVPDRVAIAPKNVDLLIEKFQEAARAQLAANESVDPNRDGITYLITSKIGNLYERKGERVAGVERTLAALERGSKDPSGVRLIRGFFYLRMERQESDVERLQRIDKARRALDSLSTEGRSANHRRALATLAALEFDERQYAAARTALVRYIASYPDSSWTWVALLRIGQCEESVGNPTGAAEAYRRAAKVHQWMPMARVLGSAYAARALEAADDFQAALQEYRRALAGWDPTYGLTYSVPVRRSATTNDPFVPRADGALVRKDALAPRIEQLSRSLGLPGGTRLERGRALLAAGRFDDAVGELEGMLRRHPDSELSTEARYLMHRARLDGALVAADVHGRNPDDQRALAMLDAIEREPLDFIVTAGRVMRATLLLKAGRRTEAQAVLEKALAAWYDLQPLTRPAGPLEADVAQIRRAVFLPKGEGIYGTTRWNAFNWPSSPLPFLLVNREVRVVLHDGDGLMVHVAERLPQVGKVLFANTEEIDLLESFLARLGGTKRREPQHIMETPNQPVGDSMQILGLWSQFFPGRPGHWGGWELETYPVITDITFADPERTKAAARVTIGYSGATVELEKEDGRWVAKRLTSQWIT
ncbi:MAG: tetratricopeptide repeat protein [Acidobacteria bacterium]|nr:tetratricopeptide repeat protein [Acidobacteriota bacterium]